MERNAAHRPVLRQEVLALLEPEGRRVQLDCTIGPGGHAEALLAAAPPEAILIGIDLDERNLRLSRERLSSLGSRVRLFQANFAELDVVLAEAGQSRADLILADLGVASGQLGDPDRGFSFLADGPLDMRFDRTATRTAADLVNDLGGAELADLIYEYGQERYSRRIARAVVAARTSKRIERTGELARIVASAYRAPAARARRGVHPARRTFQALRIAVNDELHNLDRLLAKLPEVLSPAGRAGIISFHSLEDRRVKNEFANVAAGRRVRVLTKGPLRPTREEIAGNPRSRSAKLRGIERIE